MFEGKNIHFSPVDNKPLCSYSNKLCRQRRLNGYAFCIRHILEDKSAPFKQCEFVTRNNSQKCLNAIPLNQERGYCHSHMQVAGIIPKTERKPKLPSSTSGAVSGNGGVAGNSDSSVGKNGFTGADKNGVQDRLPLVKDNKKNGSNFCSPANNHSLTQSSNNFVRALDSKVKGRVSETPQQKVKEIAAAVSLGQKNKTNSLNTGSKDKGAVTNGTESASSAANKKDAKKAPKQSGAGKSQSGNAPAKKKSLPNLKAVVVTKTQNNVSASSGSPIATLCVRDRWKHFQFLNGISESKSSVKLEHIKNLRILEKLPLFTEVTGGDAQNPKSCNQEEEFHHQKQKNLPSGIEVLLTPPFLNKASSTRVKVRSENRDNIIEEECSILDESDGLVKKIKIETEKIPAKSEGDPDLIQSEFETRKEFLARVRQVFKRQYKTIRRACKLSEKQDIHEKAFRNVLLSCALQDSSLCAKILESSKAEVGLPGVDFLDSEKSKSLKIQEGSSVPKIVGNKKPVSVVKPNGARCNTASFERNCKINQSADSESISTYNDVSSKECETKFVNRAGANCMWNNMSPEHKKIVTTTSKSNGINNLDYMHSNGMLSKMHTGGNRGAKQHLINSGNKHKKSISPNGIASKGSTKKRRIDIGSDNSVDSTSGSNFKESNHLPGSVSRQIRTLNFEHKSKLNQVAHDSHITSSFDSVLNSASSSEAATTPEGVMTDGSFDSPFDNSTSSHPDCDFSDDDLEQSFDLPIDPEIAHQASRLLEDTGFTEDDLNELFHSGDQKLIGRGDLNDLGIDFTSNFDTSDIDYSLFANIFSTYRSNQPESISVNNQF